MQDIKVLFETIEQLLRSCDIDYQALQQEKITKEWFEVYENRMFLKIGHKKNPDALDEGQG